MPISISGIASGVDTADMVQKLVELERAPIQRLQQSEKEIQYENEALLELRRRCKVLQDALKVLSGFEAAFEQKTIETTPQGYVEGVANKKALEGSYKIEVVALASSLSFASKALDPQSKVPAGQIAFSGKSATFAGGSLTDFRDFLNKSFSDLLTAKIVQVRENQVTLILETKQTGMESLLKIEDLNGILAELDMYRAGIAQEPTKVKPQEPTPASQPAGLSEVKLFQASQLKNYQGQYQIRQQGKTLFLESNSHILWQLEPTQLEKIKNIQLKINRFSPKALEKVATKDYLEEGPVNVLNIKGIELHTYTIARQRSTTPSSSEDFGLVIHYGDTNRKSETISLKNVASEFSYQLPANPKAIEFFTTAIPVEFSEVTWEKEKDNLTPQSIADKQEPKETENQQKIFPHLIRPARNAQLKVNGTPIERSSNRDLKDIIENTSLNLLKASPGEEIELLIKTNQEKALEQIKNFIKAYNELMLYAQEASKTVEIKEVGKYTEMKKNQGILVTNATVRSLIQGLKIQVSNPYPAVREPYYRTLAAIGITTGAIGAKWEEISQGQLILEENKLIDALTNHPLAVKELFVLDSNSDNRPDNGFAYTTEKFLDPYTRLTGGVITAQINNNQERLKQIARDIKKVEEHAKAYEAKLKQRFGYMEANIAKQKATGKFLNDRLGNSKKEE